jgi:hypothetical protein
MPQPRQTHVSTFEIIIAIEVGILALATLIDLFRRGA